MSRIPPSAPSELKGDQKKAHDEMASIADDIFGDTFVYKRDDGALVGPFAPLIHTPAMAPLFMHQAVEMGKIPGLPQKARETAILTTGSYFKAAYEIYAHEKVAVAKTELTRDQVKKITSGEKPDDLDEECSIAFDTAMELVKKPGPLSKQNWDRLNKAFGQQGALALIHFVGYYCYTCVLLNGCDVPVPDGEKKM
ncbi:hypothetical protein BT93_L0348 [Corymbia citriodora subsp. variegata]|uniref:Carboxymuconolactone decarboxylase-like domain-containing protein n=1 Tax=Corymbia citriodora subsp. variegata TaxID=360336 RepID=A0A8T0CGK3_CORYI|nr:hypothetical protein BT93_L0348 [Corymbia citriodora subsp. variegata]